MEERTPLCVTLFDAADYDLAVLADTLTTYKGSASRNPTPVTVEQLQDIDSSPTNLLFLQRTDDAEQKVVGYAHVAIMHLEDRAHLGPIAVDTTGTPRGHGTPLMEHVIEYIKQQYPALRRMDLTNRLDHDHSAWYQKFGFVPRTEENGDPSTIFRLPLT